MAAISGTIGLEKSTTENYIKLLEAVFLVYRLPAWGTTLGSRVTKHPKVHVVDSARAGWPPEPYPGEDRSSRSRGPH